MQTSTAILETLERAIRHPAWAYVNAWHHPPLLVPFRTHAPRSDRTVPELLGVDHVTLTATDLDRSEEFYA